MRRVIAALTATALVLLVPAAAQAGSTSHQDPNDTAGPLDLARVQLKTQGKKMVVTVTNHGDFADADLSGLSTMGIDFRVGNKIRGITVKSAMGGGLVSEICDYPLSGPPTWKNCSKVKVSRVDGATVRLRVARAKIDRGARVYRWRAGAVTSTYGGECSNIAPQCIDKLPGGNKFLTWRP
jgi:hypothetical protein